MAKAKKKAPAKKATPKKTAKKAAPKSAAKKAAPKKATAKKVAAKKATPAKKSSSVGTSSAAKSSKAASLAQSQKAKVNWETFLTPLDDRLLVEIASGERMTAGGLYIPDTVADTSGNFKGTVLVAGRGHRDSKGRVRPMDVKTGDTVLFSEFSGARLNLLGQEILLLRESDVLGILDQK